MLRLLAFLMVWCAHASFAFHGRIPERILSLVNGAGSLGVPVFFFLSAYLITELLRREHALTGTVSLPRFYVRRMLRIWPLYFGILALYGLLGLRFHGFRLEPGRLLASVLMAGNWYIARHPLLTTPLRHLWSISVEEQWYVLWPVFFLTLPRKYLLPFVGCLFVGSQCLLLHLARGTGASLPVGLWVNSGVQFQFLALGAAAALVLQGRVPHVGALLRGLLGTAAAGAFLLAAGPFVIKQSAGAHPAASLLLAYLAAGLGAGCLFFAFLGLPARRCPPVLVRLGQLSFGLYVLHETAFFLAEESARHLWGVDVTQWSSAQTAACLMCALALTACLAWVSYRAWEQPFLKLKERWTVVQSRPPA